MKRYIIGEAGRHGSYRRQDFQGDVLGAVYSYAEISGMMIPGHAMGRDAWAERAAKRGLIGEETARRYGEALNAALSARATDPDATVEDIYLDVRRLRASEMGRAVVDEMDRRDASEAGDRAWEMDVDQSALGERLLEECRCALFVLADARLCSVMRAHMAEARRHGAALYAATWAEHGAGELIQRLAPDARVVGLSDGGEIDADEALRQAMDAGKACVFWYGETGLTRCRHMALPAMVWCEPESLTARALVGQFTKKGLCAVYVPAGFDILPFVPMVRRTLANYRHFAWLCAEHGEEVYRMSAEALYRRWPEMFFSVYEESDRGLPEGVAWPEAGEADDDWWADFCRRRDKAIGRWLKATPGLEGVSGWFELGTMAQKPVPWNASGEAKGILVHGVVARQVKSASVRLSEGAPISPRLLLRESAAPTDHQLISNYLFFLTPRLTELYNRLRSGRPREQSAMRGGHLDYMLFRDEAGRRTETFPLYEKACMGLTEDGRFLFFHFRLRGGQITINEQTAVWDAGDVDPAEPGEAAVYTPYLSRADAGANRFTYARAVGADRVNFVVNQTELTCVRDGDVLLPGTGVVLSLEREKGLLFARACGFREAGDGYFTWDKSPALAVRLEHPGEVDPETWRGMRCAYGGGLTLIRNGEPVFSRRGDASLSLAREGWTSPLSAQTQESDIAALARHPRTAIGLTRSGAVFILVFSGRSSVSAGADYVEMCEIAKRLVPDASDLMNVDGGGSAVLGVAMGRRFVEFSWPSTSFDSLAGMVRPVNSLLSLALNK